MGREEENSNIESGIIGSALESAVLAARRKKKATLMMEGYLECAKYHNRRKQKKKAAKLLEEAKSELEKIQEDKDNSSVAQLLDSVAMLMQETR